MAAFSGVRTTSTATASRDTACIVLLIHPKVCIATCLKRGLVCKFHCLDNTRPLTAAMACVNSYAQQHRSGIAATI